MRYGLSVCVRKHRGGMELLNHWRSQGGGCQNQVTCYSSLQSFLLLNVWRVDGRRGVSVTESRRWRWVDDR